eukprot:6181744-Pleurochrysis_carterae.AAC.3
MCKQRPRCLPHLSALRLCARQVSAGADMYAAKYKGISLCMLLLTRALSGEPPRPRSDPRRPRAHCKQLPSAGVAAVQALVAARLVMAQRLDLV